MTVAVGGDTFSLPSAADSSLNQFRFVVSDANAEGTVPAEGAQIHGIQQNKPAAAGRGMTVQLNGVSKLRIAGTVNEQDRLRASDAAGGLGSGTASATNLHDYGAIALEAGSSGAFIAVLVTPGGQISA